jgi:hypothetical protein
MSAIEKSVEATELESPCKFPCEGAGNLQAASSGRVKGSSILFLAQYSLLNR